MQDNTFDRIWDKVLMPAFNEFQNSYGDLICPEQGRREVKQYYEDLISYAKNHYMANPNGLLNRHKVCASIMIAILKAKPIKKVSRTFYLPNEKGKLLVWPFNEELAIIVGLSTLRCYIEARVDYAFSGKKISRQIFGGVCQQDKIIFKNGVPLSNQERTEWMWELYQIRQDGAYNILAIAHLLSVMEKNARLEYFVKHKDECAVYPDEKYFVDDMVDLPQIEDVLGLHEVIVNI